MTDLIERLKEHKEWAEANIYEVPITLPDDIGEAIEALPKKGEWIEGEIEQIGVMAVTTKKCSCCHEEAVFYVETIAHKVWSILSFCPNCGAKMIEVEE